MARAGLRAGAGRTSPLAAPAPRTARLRRRLALAARAYTLRTRVPASRPASAVPEPVWDGRDGGPAVPRAGVLRRGAGAARRPRDGRAWCLPRLARCACPA